MDAVYDWSRFNSLPRGYEWIRQEIRKDFKLASKLVEATALYGNQATARRIGYLLDTFVQTSIIINRLQLQLSDSKALIPWIPGRPVKGSVNRKWGLIVNG
jgi:predicted transcriptional regulator of viral defense system